MKCDAAQGCGHTASSDTPLDSTANGLVDFGERFTLPIDFKLSAVLSTNNQNQAYITTISHLAAEYASSLNGGLSSTNVATANSQVGQLFKLNGDLTKIKPVDITEPNDVLAADEEQTQLSVLAVAVLSSLDASSITQDIATLSADFVSNQGQLVQTNDSTDSATLDNISKRAAVIARKIDRDDNAIVFNRMKLNAASAASGAVTAAAPSPTLLNDNFDKAAALVADLQLWENIINVRDNSNADLNSMREKRAAFEETLVPELLDMQNSLAVAMPWGLLPALPQLLINGFCDTVGGVFANSCKSLVNLDQLQLSCAQSNLVLFGQDLCEYLSDMPIKTNGNYTVRYQFFDGTVTVDGDIGDNAVDITMSVDVDDLKRIAFNTAGTLTSSTATFQVDNSSTSFNFKEAISILAMKLPETIEVMAEGNIAQNEDASDDPMKFSGKFDLNIDLSAASENDSDQETEETIEQTRSLILGENVSYQLNLDGSFETAVSNDRFDTKLVVVGEQDTNYSLTVDLDSDDLSTTASATLTGAMTKAENDEAASNDSVLELVYDNKVIEIEKSSSSNQVVVTNQDSIILNIDSSVESGIVGSASAGGVSLGDIFISEGSYSMVLSNGTEFALF